MKESPTERIVRIIPKESPFRVGDIADEIYPHLVRYDREGRTFNRGCATVARLLRKIDGIQEKPRGIFFAHEEYFYDEGATTH